MLRKSHIYTRFRREFIVLYPPLPALFFTTTDFHLVCFFSLVRILWNGKLGWCPNRLARREKHACVLDSAMGAVLDVPSPSSVKGAGSLYRPRGGLATACSGTHPGDLFFRCSFSFFGGAGLNPLGGSGWVSFEQVLVTLLRDEFRAGRVPRRKKKSSTQRSRSLRSASLLEFFLTISIGSR